MKYVSNGFFLSIIIFSTVYSSQELLTNLNALTKSLKDLTTLLRPTEGKKPIPLLFHKDDEKGNVEIFNKIKSAVGDFAIKPIKIENKDSIPKAEKAIIFTLWSGSRQEMVLPGKEIIEDILNKIRTPIFIMAKAGSPASANYPASVGTAIKKILGDESKDILGFGFWYDMHLKVDEDAKSYVENTNYKENIEKLKKIILQ